MTRSCSTSTPRLPRRSGVTDAPSTSQAEPCPWPPSSTHKASAAGLTRRTNRQSDSLPFVPSAFAKHGIAYKHCPLNASELYIAALPTFRHWRGDRTAQPSRCGRHRQHTGRSCLHGRARREVAVTRRRRCGHGQSRPIWEIAQMHDPPHGPARRQPQLPPIRFGAVANARYGAADRREYRQAAGLAAGIIPNYVPRITFSDIKLVHLTCFACTTI